MNTIVHQRLPLPGGQIADDQRLGPLSAELIRLRVPGITPSDGKDALLQKYRALVWEVADKIRPQPNWALGMPIADDVLQRAVKKIGDAAEGTAK